VCVANLQTSVQRKSNILLFTIFVLNLESGSLYLHAPNTPQKKVYICMFTWFGMEQDRVLWVEGVCLESRRSQGTEVMKLKVTLLANKPLSRAILFAPHTIEQVRKIHHWERVLRVAEVKNLLPKYELWRGRKLHMWRRRRGLFGHIACGVVVITRRCDLVFHCWWRSLKLVASCFPHLF